MITPRPAHPIDTARQWCVWHRETRLGTWRRVASVGSRHAAERFAVRAAGEWLALPRGTSPGSGGRVGTPELDA